MGGAIKASPALKSKILFITDMDAMTIEEEIIHGIGAVIEAEDKEKIEIQTLRDIFSTGIF